MEIENNDIIDDTNKQSPDKQILFNVIDDEQEQKIENKEMIEEKDIATKKKDKNEHKSKLEYFINFI